MGNCQRGARRHYRVTRGFEEAGQRLCQSDQEPHTPRGTTVVTKKLDVPERSSLGSVPHAGECTICVGCSLRSVVITRRYAVCARLLAIQSRPVLFCGQVRVALYDLGRIFGVSLHACQLHLQ